LRLRFAAEIAAEHAGSDGGPARLRQLTAWFEQANRTREWMRGPIRGDLAILDLLMAWPGDTA
jgi:DNA polymerase III, delta prime subunit (EC 2.7.7.7)